MRKSYGMNTGGPKVASTAPAGQPGEIATETGSPVGMGQTRAPRKKRRLVSAEAGGKSTGPGMGMGGMRAGFGRI